MGRDNKENLSINIMKKANIRIAMWYREMNIFVCAMFVQIFIFPFLLLQCLSWILFVQSNVENPKNILLALKNDKKIFLFIWASFVDEVVFSWMCVIEKVSQK